MARVLVADDEPKLGRLVAEVMRAGGHDTRRASTGTEALDLLDKETFDVVITDLMLPGASGLDILARARLVPDPPGVIVMTAFGSTENAVAAMKAGAADYVTKPFSMDEMRMRADRLAAHRQQQRRTEQLVRQITGSLVVRSPQMQQVLQQAGQVAATDTTVLLLGESGTGKSQIARHIHYSSPRAAGPFVEVHCASLTEALLEAELFGHEEGATPGSAKEGVLARADGGTVFLDEIGDVPAAMQVKLLRFLQGYEFMPVGGSQARTVNLRVVAATNRDLEAAVKAGDFREDLYYRLNVFGITIPPLRERREDIQGLTESFLQRRGIPITKLTERARQRLSAYGWPGNVRELHNVLERATILAGDALLDEAHLGPAAERDKGEQVDRLSDLLQEGFNLDLFERDLVYKAIELAGGNKAAAARHLGITRRRLYSRLKSLDERAQGLGEAD